jgi:hypothetical protein
VNLCGTSKTSILNSPNRVAPLAAQFGRPISQKWCFCGDSVGEQCFCQIPREEGEPITLCCPGCTIQYLDSVAVSDIQQPQLNVLENSMHCFIARKQTVAMNPGALKLAGATPDTRVRSLVAGRAQRLRSGEAPRMTLQIPRWLATRFSQAVLVRPVGKAGSSSFKSCNDVKLTREPRNRPLLNRD